MSIVEFFPTTTTPDKIVLKNRCPLCGKINELVLDNTPEIRDGIAKFDYGRGDIIQHCLPMLNANQREFFLTGNCSCMWG